MGANASGKSNIRDAFRFLHGIGRGYTLADILGGKGGQREWEGIRGAPNEIARLRKTYPHGSSSFMVQLKLTLLERDHDLLYKGRIQFGVRVRGAERRARDRIGDDL